MPAISTVMAMMQILSRTATQRPNILCLYFRVFPESVTITPCRQHEPQPLGCKESMTYISSGASVLQISHSAPHRFCQTWCIMSGAQLQRWKVLLWACNRAPHKYARSCKPCHRVVAWHVLYGKTALQQASWGHLSVCNAERLP